MWRVILQGIDGCIRAIFSPAAQQGEEEDISDFQQQYASNDTFDTSLVNLVNLVNVHTSICTSERDAS